MVKKTVCPLDRRVSADTTVCPMRANSTSSRQIVVVLNPGRCTVEKGSASAISHTRLEKVVLVKMTGPRRENLIKRLDRL